MLLPDFWTGLIVGLGLVVGLRTAWANRPSRERQRQRVRVCRRPWTVAEPRSNIAHIYRAHIYRTAFPAPPRTVDERPYNGDLDGWR